MKTPTFTVTASRKKRRKPIFTEKLTDHEDMIGLACEGKLGQSDLKQMHALLLERLQEMGKPGLVLDLTRFKGYKGPPALLEYLKIDTARRNNFRRVAVAGEEALMEWGTRFADVPTKAELGQFDPAEMDAAIAWVREG